MRHCIPCSSRCRKEGHLRAGLSPRHFTPLVHPQENSGSFSYLWCLCKNNIFRLVWIGNQKRPQHPLTTARVNAPLMPIRISAERSVTLSHTVSQCHTCHTLSHMITIVHSHQSDTLQHQYFQACTLTVLESCVDGCDTTHTTETAKKTCEEVCTLVTLVLLFSVHPQKINPGSLS